MRSRSVNEQGEIVICRREASWDGYIFFGDRSIYVIVCGLVGTAENSGMSPSAMVGCVKIASRKAV